MAARCSSLDLGLVVCTAGFLVEQAETDTNQVHNLGERQTEARTAAGDILAGGIQGPGLGRTAAGIPRHYQKS